MARSTKQPHAKVYWRAGHDVELQARLHADIRAGKGTVSAIIRQALMEHYGLSSRPTPAQLDMRKLTDTLSDLTKVVASLQAQVAQLHEQLGALAYQAAVQQQEAALRQREMELLHAERRRLENLLLAATFGDKSARQRAQQAALALVRPTGNGGNGGSSG